MIDAWGGVQIIVHVHMVGSGYDGVVDGRWGTRIETVRACMGKCKARQWRRCKRNMIDVVGIVLDVVKAFGVLGREGFPSSGDGFKVGRTGSITKGLAHRNEQEWADDETFSANDVGVVFALVVCTTDIIIKEVDFLVWEGDA